MGLAGLRFDTEELGKMGIGEFCAGIDAVTDGAEFRGVGVELVDVCSRERVALGPMRAAVVGAEPLARSEVVSRMWAYIKEHKLQNEQNKREILSDAKLLAIFDNTDKVSMFEMNKHLSKHLTAKKD